MDLSAATGRRRALDATIEAALRAKFVFGAGHTRCGLVQAAVRGAMGLNNQDRLLAIRVREVLARLGYPRVTISGFRHYKGVKLKCHGPTNKELAG